MLPTVLHSYKLYERYDKGTENKPINKKKSRNYSFLQNNYSFLHSYKTPISVGKGIQFSISRCWRAFPTVSYSVLQSYSIERKSRFRLTL